MRDNRLDIIRGFAILLLTATHTVSGPYLFETWGHYYILTGFFFHGADIFVAFSGLVCGIVYKRMISENGFVYGMQRGISRALQLFLFNILSFLLVTIIVVTFHSAGVFAKFHTFEDIYSAGFGTILLYDPIQYFNILNFYIILLFMVAPFVFLQSHSILPIILSALIYVIYSILFFLGYINTNVSTFFVSPLAWQFMFFGGVTIGMNYNRVRSALPPLGAVMGPILLYFFVMHFMRDQKWIVHNFSAKYHLGFLRIVDLILISYVIDRLVQPDVKITSPTMKRISSIGSNSLFCFSVTLILCYTGSNFLVVFDNSRFAYLLVLVLELFFMLGLGQLLLSYPKFRLATQANWITRAIAGR